jgi:DNA-directed RNA polymerase specialized sigma subunit
MAKRIGINKLMEYGGTMEIEQVIEKLKNYRYEVLSLNRINGKIKNIRELTQTPTSTKYDGVQSANKQTLNEKIANLVDLEFEFIKKSVEIELELSRIENTINSLDTKLALVLKYFYLDGYSTLKIAKIMNYAESHIYTLKKMAIEKLGEIL